MPTPLQIVRLVFLLWLTLLYSAPQANGEIETNNEIKIDKYKRPVAFSIKGTLLKLDKKLQKDFYLVEDAFVFEKMPFLLNKKKYIWLVVKIPSKPKSLGQGFCGAGTEDYLYLAGYTGTQLSYVDRFLVRSCLNNIEVGHGEDLEKKHLKVLRTDNAIQFTQHRFEKSKELLSQVTLIPRPRNISPHIITQPVQ